ncbi:MAG TPA: M42 family peptidase [Phycisphaerae bacterium]|nr:M42 family peptidase [Phycisphaerae bacterium]HOJ73546.1 M42 family peptidase [Phycisphaerae bacterium]HOM51646.1 M42 family peptidase [Phycisphaerae bacterium]HON65517.1 M42 family peptidase [Phycisphaerae bacterium]HOQ85360.1 M42 family peptidase [Phycisphaerae bacterium]
MEFLKQLSELPGVPGREERVRELIQAQTRGLFDETRVDALGNLICRKKPGKTGKKAAQRVLIACHIDEIGFYVRAIDDKGRLRLQNVGGFDTRNLFARRVLVQGRRDLLGVMNPTGRPIHMASEEEKKKIPEVHEFFVDLFLSKEEVDKLVRVGDPVTLVQSFEEIGDVVCGKSLDNRVASWVAINAIRKVGKKSPYDIYYAATVQEEVGCRGAGPTAFGIEPDVAIALDTTLACDTPGIDPVDSITQLGKGVAIKVLDGGSISHRGLLDEFVALADSKKIPYQLEILPRGSTDASSMQRVRGGYKTITLSIPTRYIHTVCESAHKNDLQAAVDLLAAWLAG